MLDGDQWACEGATPTCEDMVKYAHAKARLLVQLPWYQNPIEVTVEEVVRGGELFKFNGVFGNETWCRTSDAVVIAYLSTPEKSRYTGDPSADEIQLAMRAMMGSPPPPLKLSLWSKIKRLFWRHYET